MDFASLTPPPLPRPPAWICALTTTTALPCRKELLRRSVRLFERCGHLAVGHGHAILPQDLFRLILVDLHARSRMSRVRGVTHVMVATRGNAEQVRVERLSTGACEHGPSLQPHDQPHDSAGVDRLCCQRGAFCQVLRHACDYQDGRGIRAGRHLAAALALR